MDPLADVYSSISPYVYVLNNPLIYIDPDGMRVDPVNLLNSGNQELIDAFNLFASSETGIALLSKFAQKGQTIGGHTFDADGEFHAQGINLSFNAWEGNSSDAEGYKTSFGANGVTRTEETAEGGLEIGVFINSELNSSSNPAADAFQSNPNDETKGDFVNSKMGTIFHETSIHADGNATDYIQDCQLNCSNISNHYGLDPPVKTNRTIIQHKNAKSPGSTFNTKIVPAIISISERNGSKLKSNEIRKRTLNFHN